MLRRSKKFRSSFECSSGPLARAYFGWTRVVVVVWAYMVVACYLLALENRKIFLRLIRTQKLSGVWCVRMYHVSRFCTVCANMGLSGQCVVFIMDI